MNHGGDGFFGFAFGLAIAVVGIFITNGCTTGHWQERAVQHGAAHWEVKNNGSTVFHWNDEQPDNARHQ